MPAKGDTSGGWAYGSNSNSMRPLRTARKKVRPGNAARGLVAGLARLFLGLYVGLHVTWAIALVVLRYVNPPTTGVQIQRRVESMLPQKWFPKVTFARGKYQKRVRFVPLEKISPDLQHAVISAEDGNYYRHHGIDWTAVQKVAQESGERGKITRGASTITQQLVKNLFFTLHRNPIRKGFEYTLAPMADVILGKKRELELYLNIVEWGPGVWGAEAAAQYHYHTTAAKLDRDQAARLAACLPSPRRYKPSFMNDYSAAIEDRMNQVGW